VAALVANMVFNFALLAVLYQVMVPDELKAQGVMAAIGKAAGPAPGAGHCQRAVQLPEPGPALVLAGQDRCLPAPAGLGRLSAAPAAGLRGHGWRAAGPAALAAGFSAMSVWERIGSLSLLVGGGGATCGGHAGDGLPPARPARALISLWRLYFRVTPLKRRPRSGRNEKLMSRLFRSVEGGELFPNGSVVCIGAFDGLHLGIVRWSATRSPARALGVAAVAVAFEPLPREFFAQGTPPPRLTLARSKVEILRELGVDAIGLLRFDAAMAAMPAETFVRQLLVNA
jgi:hypothetical protein